MDGHINKQNWRIWADEKPENFVEKSAHPDYVTVFCAISAQGIIGPYFFEDSNSKRITVNQLTYQNMLEKFFIPKLRSITGEKFKDQIFQQDGASPHTVKSTMDF